MRNTVRKFIEISREMVKALQIGGLVLCKHKARAGTASSSSPELRVDQPTEYNSHE